MNFLPVVLIFGHIQFSATTFSRVGLVTTRYETPDRGNKFPATETQRVSCVRSKMADRDPSGNNFSLAINLLRQATEVLSSSELSENEKNSSSSTPARASSSSIRSQNTISPNLVPRALPPGPASQYRMPVSKMFTVNALKRHIFPSKNKYLET